MEEAGGEDSPSVSGATTIEPLHTTITSQRYTIIYHNRRYHHRATITAINADADTDTAVAMAIAI